MTQGAERIIRTEIAAVAQEMHVIPPLEILNTTSLSDLGFDSLDFAVLVVRLEERFGRDPFWHARTLPRTFAEFVAAYEDA